MKSYIAALVATFVVASLGWWAIMSALPILGVPVLALCVVFAYYYCAVKVSGSVVQFVKDIEEEVSVWVPIR